MRLFIIYVFVLLVTLLSPQPHTAHAETIKVFTVPLPPLKFEENNAPKGIFVDILKDIMNSMNIPLDDTSFTSATWTRAYQDSLKRPDSIILSIARTKDRENLFKWVGPVYAITLGLIGKKDQHFVINTPQDALQYRVGSLKNTAPEQLFIAQGFPQPALREISKLEHALMMLDAGRLDLFVHTADSSYYTMDTLGIDRTKYHTAYVIQKVELYFGLNKSIPDDIVLQMQKHLDEMKQEDENGQSRYKEIVNSYIKP